MGVHRPHRGGAEGNLVVGVGISSVHGGQQQGTSYGISGQGVDRLAVYLHVGADSARNSRDSPHPLQMGEHRRGNSGRPVEAERHIEWLSIERRGRGQVSETGTEDGGGTECGDGEDRTEHG